MPVKSISSSLPPLNLRGENFIPAQVKGRNIATIILVGLGIFTGTAAVVVVIIPFAFHVTPIIALAGGIPLGVITVIFFGAALGSQCGGRILQSYNRPPINDPYAQGRLNHSAQTGYRSPFSRKFRRIST